jgi:hypothetical protein
MKIASAAKQREKKTNITEAKQFSAKQAVGKLRRKKLVVAKMRDAATKMGSFFVESEKEE